MPASSDAAQLLMRFEEQLGYHFQDHQLLVQALTHGSGATDAGANNERLEFFGDSVLDLIVCEWLFHAYPASREGDLTAIKGDAVSRSSLVDAALRLEMPGVLRTGRGVGGGGRVPDSLCGNALEAVFAAVYLDGGLEEARACVLRILAPELERACGSARRRNVKSMLQEWAQREKLGEIEYRVVKEEGPEHRRNFTIEAWLGDCFLGQGGGRSKKEAEQSAAAAALEQIPPADGAKEAAN